jgi:hypothetical protein
MSHKSLLVFDGYFMYKIVFEHINMQFMWYIVYDMVDFGVMGSGLKVYLM